MHGPWTWLESGMPPLPPNRPAARRSLPAIGGLFLLAGFALLPAPLRATAANVLPSVYEPAGTGGYAALERALAKLQTHRRLLVIGAHPDDEDTSALALVSRELGGEAAYLSLSRGEGGQNLIGPDLGEALGVLRTQELLAARGVDGARQYFTRAFDFGYTRSLPETFGKWPEEALLADAVRILRRFKPQVILSVFGNDGSGGHGQHQAAGHTAFLAFARSAQALPALDESGETAAPWKAQALFRAAWFAPESATVSRPLGAIDPWSGLSTLQLAMRSRSQHRSQDMGRLIELGPRDGKYTFVEGPGGAAGNDLFAGIDTSLAGLAATLGSTPLAGEVRRGAREGRRRDHVRGGRPAPRAHGRHCGAARARSLGARPGAGCLPCERAARGPARRRAHRREDRDRRAGAAHRERCGARRLRRPGGARAGRAGEAHRRALERRPERE